MFTDIRRLLVLSDTHGRITTLEAVLKWVKCLAVDTAVFLGDGIRDISRADAGFSPEWKFVRGNNDDTFSVPEADVLDFCGHRFFLCHGHRYSLYGGFHTLIAAARNREAQAVLFGHTHAPYCDTAEGIRLINPGSIGRPRAGIGPTFAIIECATEPAAGSRQGRGSPPVMPFEAHFFGISPEWEIRGIDI